MTTAITTGMAIAAVACGACGGRGGEPPARIAAPVEVVASPPPAVAVAPAVGPACAAPLVVAAPYREPWLDDAAGGPVIDGGPWTAAAMRGPAATLTEAAPGCIEQARAPAAAPFDEIVHCATGRGDRPLGPDNIAEHRLVLHTAGGWWSHELVRAYWPHGDPDDEARVADVSQLATGDRTGEPGVEVTLLAEHGPPGGSKTRIVIVCGLGGSGIPACANIRVAAGGPFHGAGALLYDLTLACDGTLTLAGWEGGAPVRLVHARYQLRFP